MVLSVDEIAALCERSPGLEAWVLLDGAARERTCCTSRVPLQSDPVRIRQRSHDTGDDVMADEETSDGGKDDKGTGRRPPRPARHRSSVGATC